MIKRFFIPAVILFTAFNAAGQQHLNVETASMKQSDGKKLRILSSFQVPYQLQLPADGAAIGYANDRLLFSGHVRKQKLNGKWVSFYSTNNLLDSGYLRNGIPDGEWKRWDSSGQLVAIRNYDADKLQRVKNEMQVNHPKRSFYSLTALYKTNRQQALYYLSTTHSFPATTTQEPVRSLQQLVERNNSGQHSYHPVFNECLHHGLYMNFFPGGITKDSGYYNNGLREAVWLHRNSPAGYYFVGSYKNGFRYREWKQYDAAGKLHSIVYYNNEGQVEWTKDIRR